MITIKRLEEQGLCVFCDKTKEVAAVVVDGQGSDEILLCWADIKKLAKMRMRVASTPSKDDFASLDSLPTTKERE